MIAKARAHLKEAVDLLYIVITDECEYPDLTFLEVVAWKISEIVDDLVTYSNDMDDMSDEEKADAFLFGNLK